VVAHGDFTMLVPHDERVYAFTRRLDDTELLVLGNFSGEALEVSVPDAERWAAAELLAGERREGESLLSLLPWEGRVLKARRA
jgi:oligo-1,6-glucosidase